MSYTAHKWGRRTADGRVWLKCSVCGLTTSPNSREAGYGVMCPGPGGNTIDLMAALKRSLRERENT